MKHYKHDYDQNGYFQGCYYEQDGGLKYPQLGPTEAKVRKICGVSVVQRHDWSNIRYREIKSSIEGRPFSYARCGRQIELAV